jgi:transcription initiation factor TFIIB
MNSSDIEELLNQFERLRNCDKNEEAAVPSKNICINPNCPANSIVEDYANGDLVCTNCGIVNTSHLIDETAEWNYGAPDSTGPDPSRCGAPTNSLFEQSSMSTMISGGRQNSLMQRIHRQGCMNYVERARYHVCESIQKMAGDAGNLLPIIVEDAKHLYKTLSEKKLSRGSVRQGLIACCILYSCKSHKVNRSIREISQMCNVDVSTINKSVKIFEDVMQFEIKAMNASVATGFHSLVVRYVDFFNIDKTTKRTLMKQATLLHDNVEKDGILQGKTPSAITSATLCYTLSKMGIQVNKADVSTQHKVSIVTLNKIIGILKNYEEGGI